MYQRAKNPKDMWVIPQGDHALSGHGDEIYERLSAFIREIGAPAQL